jgi:hypothetical protein
MIPMLFKSDTGTCEEQHRIENEDGSCGDCLEGYWENDDENCRQSIDANALLYMSFGLAIFCVIFAPLPFAESLFKKK